MATTYELIAKNVLGSAAASVTFGSIPGAFDDVLLFASARSSTSNIDYFYVQFNGVSTNLSGRYLFANGSSVSSGTFAPYCVQTISTYTANTFSSNSVYIPNYAGATNKSFSIDAVNETNSSTAAMNIMAGLWSNTAAITEINLVPPSGNFVTGSSFYLFGITKS